MGGSVLSFGEATGRMSGVMVSENRILSSPWIENGKLYLGDNDATFTR